MIGMHEQATGVDVEVDGRRGGVGGGIEITHLLRVMQMSRSRYTSRVQRDGHYKTERERKPAQSVLMWAYLKRVE